MANVSAAFWTLLANGFVGFHWTEDGTMWSVWSIRLSSFVVLGVSFLTTFLSFLVPGSTFPLYLLYFIFPLGCFLLYVISQIVLVLNTLEDRWPLGDIFFGALFFVVAQVALFGISQLVCKLSLHYIDGVFFSNLSTLLAVMMVYKYWDSITKEDLEFSVGAPFASHSGGKLTAASSINEMEK